MNKSILNSLFTKESLMSLQGNAATALLGPNVLRYLIGSSFAAYEKWVAFGVAMLLAFWIAAQATGKGVLKWLLALFNGFLVFGAAVGLTQVFGSATGARLTGSSGSVGFFHSCYP